MGTNTLDPVRIGVVGCGSLGFHHVRLLRDLPGTRLAGFYEIRPERAAEVSRQLEVPATASLEALLDAVDAVVIAVPTSAHEEVAVAALSRGIHTLIEKPMAPTLEAADRILAVAAEAGAKVQVGHVERFNPILRAAQPYLERPLFIESLRIAPFAPRSIDVAVVLDLMIHDVDLVQGLVGKPVAEIAATGVPVLTSTVDIANARLTFEDGAVANLTASRVSMEKMRKLRIFQASGYLSLDLAAGTGEFLRLKGELPALSGDARLLPQPPEEGLAALVDRIPLRGEDGEPLRAELESFRDACQGNLEPEVSGEQGREALAVTLSIEERIRSHVAHTYPAKAQA